MSSRLSSAATALLMGAVGLVGVGAAAPASAATAQCTTTTSVSVYATTVTSGDYDRISGDVAARCTGGTYNPTSPWTDAGRTIVERSVNNGASWQAVFTDTSYDTYWSGNDIIRATGLYRIHYTGGTSAQFGDSFQESFSAPVRIAVIRKLTVSDRSTRSHSVGRFRLSPTTGLVGRRLTFQVRKAGHWRSYTRVRVTATGIFRVSFANSRRGISYRLPVPAAGGLSAHTYGPFKAYRR
ncbi:hypothetical protein [Nocardioides sp. AN3]